MLNYIRDNGLVFKAIRTWYGGDGGYRVTVGDSIPVLCDKEFYCYDGVNGSWGMSLGELWKHTPILPDVIQVLGKTYECSKVVGVCSDYMTLESGHVVPKIPKTKIGATYLGRELESVDFSKQVIKWNGSL